MTVNFITRLHEHRRWVNQGLLESVQMLSEAQRRREFPIGQGSIWKSLLHLYAAEYVWLEALLGNTAPVLPGDLPGELPGNQRGEGGVGSLEELSEKWSHLEQRWIDYLEGLTESDLVEIVSKQSTSSGKGRVHRTRRSDVLMHVCLHAQYTTAQLINMLRQAGVQNLPDSMLITLARQETAREAEFQPDES
ncbi:DinB family protein [Gimesia panareensis]|uniref:DinB family protein n=1 Tax=Gimesia panareensis TaxID=2527978 RepID=UPI00118B999A|nr:DinB family protein [Gimesia panareensis]QDU49055.1 DinB family protein [Gimesia panareensis]